LIGPPSRHP